MIFIAAKWRIRPEDADSWPEISKDFSQATAAEPGCLWFEWSRSLDDPTEYVLVEAFRDQSNQRLPGSLRVACVNACVIYGH